MNVDNLSIDAAAIALNVGREHLVQLPDEGPIPFSGGGDSRLVARSDLLAFKARRDAERRKGLEDLTRLSEEAGGYDELK